ncbi:MAG: DNA double-strand break repair nuclease NurA [Candidatus Micrarchaeota archaeon]|nr:DNA double-strand break repair nuclease NurA [Candidatus Micrarchaeota archaeon]
MRERILEIASGIRESEERRKSLAKELREMAEKDFVLPEALERNLILKVDSSPVNSKICAVDGGLAAQEFEGMDLILVRTVAVCFEYKNSKLTSHAYHPSASPEPKIDALGALDTHEFNWHKSLFRLRHEILTAREAVEKFSPEFIFMDGSIVPQISDKPYEDSELRHVYNELALEYQNLFESAEKNNCMIVGVIKDSRGRRFIEMLAKRIENEVLATSNDTIFLQFLLNEGERTFSFPYASHEKENPILKDLGEWSKKINAFYIRPCEGDRPLRVEFVGDGKKFEQLASIILSLSRINKRYAYPAILIEADMRAALDKTYIDRAYRELFTFAGLRPSIMKLRRDERPFR